MNLLSKHRAVNRKDISTLRRLPPQPFATERLGRRNDLVKLLGDPVIAAEWPQAEAACRELILTRSGEPTHGGVNPGDRRALYTLVRALKPLRILEIGTHLGYSTLHIAQAMKRNSETDGVEAQLVTVDIRDVVSSADAPWRHAGALLSPAQAIAELGMASCVQFVASDSVAYLEQTPRTFDLIFLDGDHSAGVVFRELHALTRVIEPGVTVILHDYFPDGKALWPGSLPNTGPWRAVKRLQDDGADIEPFWLGHLPWPTKCDTNLTSMALLQRRQQGAAPVPESVL